MSTSALCETGSLKIASDRFNHHHQIFALILTNRDAPRTCGACYMRPCTCTGWRSCPQHPEGCELTYVEELLRGSKDFGSSAETTSYFTKLTRLEFFECQLTTLPDWLSKFQMLEELRLKKNEELKVLSATLSDLHKLKKLELSYCSLTSIPDFLGDIISLEELLLNGNKELRTLNDALGRLSKLRKLDLTGCSLSSVPEAVGMLSALEELLLNGNKELRTLNDAIGTLSQLKKLDLTGCSLSSVPDAVGNLIALEQLVLSGNKLLQRLNPKLGCLGRLRKLDVRRCCLQSIPDELGNLEKLEELDLSDNRLHTYPDCTLRMKMLRSLDLSSIVNPTSRQYTRKKYLASTADTSGYETPEGNRIKVLPTALAYTTLHELNLKGNPLTEPPVDIWKQGINAIKSYIRDIDKGKALLCADTINMLGDHNAGKTSIAQSLIKGSPHPATESHCTRVMEQLLFKIDEKAGLSVNINDFGGHDIYHSVIPIFLPGDGLPIIVYDMSTEPERQEMSIKNWLITVLAKSSNTRIIIAGTRADKLSPEERKLSINNAESLSKKILNEAREEIKAFQIDLILEVASHKKSEKCEKPIHENLPACVLRAADSERNLEKICKIRGRLEEVKIHVVALSCTAPDQGLDGLRRLVTKLLHEPINLPIQWCRVINDLCNAKPKCLYLTWEDVTKIAKLHLTHDSSDDSLETILKYLATTAQIFWIDDNENLRKFIFHSPKRIIEVCRKVLDHDQALQLAAEWAQYYGSGIEQYKIGFLEEKFLIRLLSENKSTSDVFVDFLQQFHLISLVASESHERTFVIPSNLPTNAPLMLETIKRKVANNVNTVNLQLSFAGSLIPMAFFETSVVSMLNVAYNLRNKGCVNDVWRDGVVIMHNDVHFIATRSGSVITITSSSVPNGASMWSILHPVLRSLNENVSTLWNGIPPNCAILCPACNWRSQQAHGNSEIGRISTNLQLLAAEITENTDKVTCSKCRVASPGCLCYPTHYGSFTAKQQKEIDEFAQALRGIEQGPPSPLIGNFTIARPFLIAELDKTSVEHIVDQLISKRLVTTEQWQLIKAEKTDNSKARLLHDIVSRRGFEAIDVMLKALVSPDGVNRPDLAHAIEKPSGK